MRMMYLIEQLWIDRMENSIDRAMGYSTVGIYYAEAGDEDLHDLLSESTEQEGWPVLGRATPLFRASPVFELQPGSLKRLPRRAS